MGEGRRALRVEHLFKTFVDQRANAKAVDDVSFEVTEGDFYTLLGPSGCGKTTTLRCVAGLERTEHGVIAIDGAVVLSDQPKIFVPPHRRPIGMVFQSYAIWPHLTVFENVAFPLRVAKERLPAVELKKRVEESLAMVELADYAGRMATQLSGGQQQRLALARAVVRRPRLLLLDEPLSNLDAKLRETMRMELRQLQRQIGVTTLYVTHDQAEALSMSDRIAVMSSGKIVQEGSPREIYHRPVTQFVANFVGTANFIDAKVLGRDPSGGMTLEGAVGRLHANCPEGVTSGDTVTLTIRPENIRVYPSDPGGTSNVFPAVVESLSFYGEFVDCRVRIGDRMFLTRQHPTVAFRSGDAVFMELPIELCAVLHDTYGIRTGSQLGQAPPSAPAVPMA